MAVDSFGNVWVADESNSRIQEFAIAPEPSALVLLATGTIGVLAYARCRRKRAAVA